jgi:hypothetical protein
MMGAANTIHNYNNCLVFVGKLLILLVGVDFGGNGKWKILCIRIWGPLHRNYYRIARNSDIHTSSWIWLPTDRSSRHCYFELEGAGAPLAHRYVDLDRLTTGRVP